jgi:hypothetical protein
VPTPLKLGTLVLMGLVLLMQGAWCVISGIEGPAHYHVTPMPGDDGHSAHSHAGLEHHHHDHDDGVVEVGEPDHQHIDAVDEGAAKRLAGFQLDALPPLLSGLARDRVASGFLRWNAFKPALPFIASLERPPDARIA